VLVEAFEGVIAPGRIWLESLEGDLPEDWALFLARLPLVISESTISRG